MKKMTNRVLPIDVFDHWPKAARSIFDGADESSKIGSFFVTEDGTLFNEIEDYGTTLSVWRGEEWVETTYEEEGL